MLNKSIQDPLLEGTEMTNARLQSGIEGSSDANADSYSYRGLFMGAVKFE